jgi:ABC-type Zn uptake system ZnuABC Zn-binding protein ZnuA
MNAFFSRVLILGLTALLLLALSACGDGEDASGDDRVHVVTSLPLFADFVREIGGDRVEVTSLLPAGADPHTWEPSPKDVKKVEQADIAFANGGGVDDPALQVIEANIGDGKEVMTFHSPGQQVNNSYPGSPADDPHFWLDPRLGGWYALAVASVLSRTDPASGPAEYIDANDRYQEALTETEKYLRDRAASVPEQHRRLITTHDAFRHLAFYLRWEVAGFVSASPGQDPGPDDIKAIVDAIHDGVPAVFTEPQVSSESETLRQIAEDEGAEVCTLYSDSLDDEVSTYIEMVRFNADEIARCLGGEP